MVTVMTALVALKYACMALVLFALASGALVVLTAAKNFIASTLFDRSTNQPPGDPASTHTLFYGSNRVMGGRAPRPVAGRKAFHPDHNL